MTTATIVRGPMAGDHYTQIHNRIARGKDLPPRYVGVYAYIASHRAGWQLTELQLAEHLGVGRDFIRAALKAMEASLLLVRERRRREDGTLGGAVWWVSDLACQLRQLDVDDDAVRQQVHDVAEGSFRRSEPALENPTLDLTSGNERLPRSEPMSGKPTLAEPTLADPTHKKTKNQEDQGSKEDHPPAPPHAAEPLAQPELEQEQEDDREFFRNLAAEMVADLPRVPVTQQPKLVPLVARKLERGWPPQVLSRQITDGTQTAMSPVGVYITRLRGDIPDDPPPLARNRSRRPVAQLEMMPRPPWCGNEDCHPETRRRVGVVAHELVDCPECSPAAVASRDEQPGTAANS